LPATTLASGCYLYMFYNCEELKYLKIKATDLIYPYFTLFDYGKIPDNLTVVVKNEDMYGLFEGIKNRYRASWTIKIEDD